MPPDSAPDVDNVPPGAYAFRMDSTKPILYVGDSSLATTACYLAGVLAHAGLAFDYLPSNQPIAPALRGRRRSLYLISDYPVKNWTDADFRTVVSAVAEGSGLLMIGGWESFHGRDGEYHASPLAEVLPVIMTPRDDREQSRRPWVVCAAATDHPILTGLPFDQPPIVGGFNRVAPKAEAEVLLQAVPLEIVVHEGAVRAEPGSAEPLLVVGAYGQGRTVALATDAAPHWVGTLVDWGERHIVARAPRAEAVEVGCWYAEFFARLIRWTARLAG